MSLVEEINKKNEKEYGPVCDICYIYEKYCRCYPVTYNHRFVVGEVVDVTLGRVLNEYYVNLSINDKDLRVKVLTSKGKIQDYFNCTDDKLTFDENVTVRSLIYSIKYEQNK